LERERVVIIPNAVVLEEIPSREKAERIPEDGILLFLGRVAFQKRVADLINAYARCKQGRLTGQRKNVPILNIVGGGNVDELKHLAASIGIGESVRFHGYSDHVEIFLQKAIAMVNASEIEGMPNSVLEACSYGVPSILSDIPIHREIANQTGMAEFLFPVGDVRALSEKIGNVFSMKREDMIKKRIQCYQYAQGLTTQNRNEAYLNLYAQIMKRCTIECGGLKKGNSA
jgi:glycosyltransferase involved in cell wall biosynthesis